MSNKHPKIQINTPTGPVPAVAPVIISASRSTDIPAFYSEWLLNRIEEGYVKWINPFNVRPLYVSFQNTRAFVFWTKNPEPMIPYLKELDNRGLHYYFTYTLNDYKAEGYEPKLPPLEERIKTFKRLSDLIGKEKVIWRFDPLILSDKTSVTGLLEKIERTGNQLAPYTEKLVISFADISGYRKVANSLKRHNVNYKEFDQETMKEIAQGLQSLNKDWNLKIATCSEKIDLSEYGICHNKCIDDELMLRLFPEDQALMDFLDIEPKSKLKDKGQRDSCGCIISKDIGQYNTCHYSCVYCYAKTTPETARRNYEEYLKSDKKQESILL